MVFINIYIMFCDAIYLRILIAFLLTVPVATTQLCLSWRNPGLGAPGLSKRQTGYHPENNVCGMGDSCQEACGNGYETCELVADTALFCFNPGEGQTCCPGGQGTCDAEFYCAQDNTGKPWCCPSGINLADCAASFGVTTMISAVSAPSTATKSHVTVTAIQTERITVWLVSTTSTASTTSPTTPLWQNETASAAISRVTASGVNRIQPHTWFIMSPVLFWSIIRAVG